MGVDAPLIRFNVKQSDGRIAGIDDAEIRWTLCSDWNKDVAALSYIMLDDNGLTDLAKHMIIWSSAISVMLRLRQLFSYELLDD